MSEQPQEDFAVNSLMEAFIDAYLKKHPELTREQALKEIRDKTH